MPRPYKPAGNKFCIGVERNPCTRIAAALRSLLDRAILSFRINETPNFIALDSLRFQIAKRLVLIFRASAAKIAEQFHDGCAMHASHSRYGTQRIALNESRNNRPSFPNTEFIHADSMLERSSIVNREIYFFFQRVAAAFRAISFRFLADSAAALAFPPFSPPSRPSITAAGFLSPVELATIAAASSFTSCGMWSTCLSGQGFATDQ
jgi:hypothetical protein